MRQFAGQVPIRGRGAAAHHTLHMSSYAIFIVFVMSLLFWETATVIAATRPNIVFILADDLGLGRNTLVIFSSYNGGVGGYVAAGIPAKEGVTDNAPLRGGKGMLYEGWREEIRAPKPVRRSPQRGRTRLAIAKPRTTCSCWLGDRNREFRAGITMTYVGL